VLCWVRVEVGDPRHMVWEENVHQGGLHLSCWHGWRTAAVEGRVVCPRPCPHLPGVCELQQQEQAAAVSSE
jgi:hypothetical protein